MYRPTNHILQSQLMRYRAAKLQNGSLWDSMCVLVHGDEGLFTLVAG